MLVSSSACENYDCLLLLSSSSLLHVTAATEVRYRSGWQIEVLYRIIVLSCKQKFPNHGNIHTRPVHGYHYL